MKFHGCLPLILALFVALPMAQAHGDVIPTDPGISKEHFTAYGQSDRYELTLYYTSIQAGQETHLTLYVADFLSNRPIENATFKISLAEVPQQILEAKAVAPGVYELHGIFPEQKKYGLHVQVTHPNGADLIAIPGIEVGKKLGEDHDHEEKNDTEHSHLNWLWFAGGILLGGLAMWYIGKRRNRTLTLLLMLLSAWFSAPHPSVMAHGDEEHGPAGGGGGFGKEVFAPKETQFLFEVRTQPIAVGDYQSATTMFGTIIPASGGMGAVTAPQTGRILKVNAAVGQTVRAGQTLAVLQQAVGTPDAVGIAANNAALEVQIETAKARVKSAKRELDRLNNIADIAAGRDVQAAEASYNAALAELQTLENKAVGSNNTANGRTVALVAPISGIVGAFTLAAGAEVQAGQTLFTITNINKVYVEAQVYDQDVAVVQSGNKFLVHCSTDDHNSAEVRLIAQAQTMNPGNQSQRVLFELDNPKGEFKIGEFVTLKALDKQTSRQISVPNSALTEINGKTAVFLKHAPEVYELAYVQTGDDDGTRTLIIKGIDQSEKVVVSGTYEIKMMYLNQ